MSNERLSIEQAIQRLGGVTKTARICGVSHEAVRKWRKRGRLPRTEWTRETQYAELIAAALGSGVSGQDLLTLNEDDAA